MRKIILFFLLLLLVGVTVGVNVVGVKAQVQTLGTFQANNTILLKQSCSNSTYSNITYVSYPNSSFIINKEINMTKSGTNYYYSFYKDNLTVLGEYIYCGHCDINGVDNTWCVNFYINGGGQPLSTAQGILYFVSLLIASGLFGLCLYFSIKIPFKNSRDDDGRVVSINKLKYLKLFLMPMTYMILLLIVGITKSILENFLYLPSISYIFNWIYWIMISMIFPIIAVAFVFIFVFLFEDNILYKKIKRGGHFR